ncbi:MAG: hypothetical protein M3O99_13140 [Chloroflexota bacterium]|nr:hypothetical protein [Chloroflexota bacterium]
MNDKDAERAVTGWLRLGDRVAGRTPIDGRCDRCAGTGYLSLVENERLCARCYLEGTTADS